MAAAPYLSSDPLLETLPPVFENPDLKKEKALFLNSLLTRALRSKEANYKKILTWRLSFSRPLSLKMDTSLLSACFSQKDPETIRLAGKLLPQKDDSSLFTSYLNALFTLSFSNEERLAAIEEACEKKQLRYSSLFNRLLIPSLLDSKTLGRVLSHAMEFPKTIGVKNALLNEWIRKALSLMLEKGDEKEAAKVLSQIDPTCLPEDHLSNHWTSLLTRFFKGEKKEDIDHFINLYLKHFSKIKKEARVPLFVSILSHLHLLFKGDRDEKSFHTHSMALLSKIFDTSLPIKCYEKAILFSLQQSKGDSSQAFHFSLLLQKATVTYWTDTRYSQNNPAIMKRHPVILKLALTGLSFTNSNEKEAYQSYLLEKLDLLLKREPKFSFSSLTPLLDMRKEEATSHQDMEYRIKELFAYAIKYNNACDLLPLLERFAFEGHFSTNTSYFDLLQGLYLIRQTMCVVHHEKIPPIDTLPSYFRIHLVSHSTNNFDIGYFEGMKNAKTLMIDTLYTLVQTGDKVRLGHACTICLNLHKAWLSAKYPEKCLLFQETLIETLKKKGVQEEICTQFKTALLHK